MSDLLTPDNWLQITSAIRDVTDTFLKAPVTYKKRQNTLDRFNEDNNVNPTVDYSLVALVEWGQASNQNLQTVDGSVPQERVTVTFDMRYLNEQGLVVINPDNSWVTVFDSASDYLFISGFYYKMDVIKYDGQAEDRQLLCVVEAQVDKNYKEGYGV